MKRQHLYRVDANSCLYIAEISYLSSVMASDVAVLCQNTGDLYIIPIILSTIDQTLLHSELQLAVKNKEIEILKKKIVKMLRES